MLKYKTTDKSWSDLVYYDETSPSCLRWKVILRSGNTRPMTEIGGIAGGKCQTNGYWTISAFKSTRKVHRVVLAVHGIVVPEDMDVDHIDGDKSNNKIQNLRLVIRPLNCRNRHKARNNSSSVTGVQWHFDKRYSDTSAVARWTDDSGKRFAKYFSCSKFGIMQAFKLACEFRKEKLRSLPSYTSRHGL